MKEFSAMHKVSWKRHGGWQQGKGQDTEQKQAMKFCMDELLQVLWKLSNLLWLIKVSFCHILYLALFGKSP